MLLRSAAMLLLLGVSATSAQLEQKPITAPLVSSFRVGMSSIGSVAAGCSLCRDSGMCSMAMNDTSSGVFCGDIYPTMAEAQPCCCAYYTECRAISRSQTCECGGAWPFALRHGRLAATEVVANATETFVRERFTPDDNKPTDNQISVTTEILIHLSAYLAFFVFAVYIDEWVECFSDFRRNRMVTYGKATTDTELLRFHQRFNKQRGNSQTDGETDDNVPLLVSETPTPTARPAFIFSVVSNQQEKEKNESTAMSQQIVVVTAPVDVFQEISICPPESITQLEEISLEYCSP